MVAAAEALYGFRCTTSAIGGPVPELLLEAAAGLVSEEGTAAARGRL